MSWKYYYSMTLLYNSSYKLRKLKKTNIMTQINKDAQFNEEFEETSQHVK
jgi:hypothetical protein